MTQSGDDVEPWEWHYKLIRQLYESAKRNEEGISELVEALEDSIDKLNAQAQSLPAAVTVGVNRELKTTIADAERKFEAAANSAGDRIVQRFTSANLNAEKASAAYLRATKVSMLWIAGMAFGCFLSGVVGVCLAVWFLTRG